MPSKAQQKHQHKKILKKSNKLPQLQVISLRLWVVDIEMDNFAVPLVWHLLAAYDLLCWIKFRHNYRKRIPPLLSHFRILNKT